MSSSPSRPPIRAEIHSHSTASDGEFSPLALRQQMAHHHVRLWSLTDHDTMKGNETLLEVFDANDLSLREALQALHDESREQGGVVFLPGVEISARDERSVHVLGYGLDPRDEELATLFETRRTEREARMHGMVEKAKTFGFELDMVELEAQAPDGNFARPHLARVLVNHGYVSDMQKAFDLYLGEGKPLYIKSPYMSVEQAVGLIRRHRGVAVVAHPGSSRRDERFGDWVEAGLDGVECWHPSHSTELSHHYEGMARRYELLQTASSDFHGPNVSPDRRLGETTLASAHAEALLSLVQRRGGRLCWIRGQG